jgi:hypothetical protein
MKKFELKKVDYGVLPEWIRDRIRLGLYVQEVETGDVWNRTTDSHLALDLWTWKQHAQPAQKENVK